MMITICGAGAIGSHLADNLARQGFRRLHVIDRGRVEQDHARDHIYGESEVGTWKVDALRQRVFRAVNVEMAVTRKELTDRNVTRCLKNSVLVIDTFAQTFSKGWVQEHCREHGVPCLHVDLHSDCAEVLWDEGYRVPADESDSGVSRNLILMTVAVASEAVQRFVQTRQRLSYAIHLDDLTISQLNVTS